jgi:hypothetical protein
MVEAVSDDRETISGEMNPDLVPVTAHQ